MGCEGEGFRGLDSRCSEGESTEVWTGIAVPLSLDYINFLV